MSNSNGSNASNSTPAVDAKPDLQSALGFLRQVKAAMPTEYDTFLDVLTQFRAKNVEAQSVVTVVVEMLIGKEYLLEGFCQFLPPACRQCLLERFMEKQSKPDAAAEGVNRTVPGNREPNSAKTEPKSRKGKPPSGKASAADRPAVQFDPSELVVAEMPTERKRKRDGGDIDLRPNAILNNYRSINRRTSQPQVYQAQLKQEITPPNLEEIWQDLERRVKERVEEALAEGDNWIPTIDFEDIKHDRVDAKAIARVRVAGVLKVRGTVPRATAEGYNEEMMGAMRHYFGVDPGDPQSYAAIYNDANPKTFTLGGVQEIYYAHPQVAARQHANMQTVRVWLNRLWSHEDKESAAPLCIPEVETTYVDRWRHRLPKYAKQVGMKEHLDNGGVSRWADPAWQKVYASILAGRLDEYDPWEVGQRAAISSSVFRSFQGWLALTAQGPADGSLFVIPLLAEAMAFVLLRPLRADVPAHQLCGVSDLSGGETLEITARWHSPLLRARMPIGPVDPGDTVWWHPDIIHGVEERHQGQGLSNVLYIPSTPMCPLNARSLRRQREAFTEGNAPPGFPNLRIEKRNAQFRAEEEHLSELGRMQMGFDPFPESLLEGDEEQREKKAAMLAECNAILFDS